MWYMTEFGVAEDHLNLQCEGDPPPHLNRVIQPYGMLDKGFFVFIAKYLFILYHFRLRYTVLYKTNTTSGVYFCFCVTVKDYI